MGGGFAPDETGALVVDVGSGISKFGYGGDDVPRVSFPSVVALDKPESQGAGGSSSFRARSSVVGDSAMTFKPGRELHCPLDDGRVLDWDLYESVMHHGFSELCVPPTEHPLMIVEPPLAVGPQRERLAELMFETFRVPALYLAKSSVTAAFSAGLATATVVDMGAAHTRVTPVFEGYQLNNGVYQSQLGGDLLSDMAGARLEQLTGGEPLRPLFMLDKRPAVDTGVPQDGARRWQSWEVTEKQLEDVRASFYHMAWRRIGQDVKESWAEVPPISLASESVRASRVERSAPEGAGGDDGDEEGDGDNDDGEAKSDRGRKREEKAEDDEESDGDGDENDDDDDDDDEDTSDDDSDAPEEVEVELPDGTSVVLGQDRRLLGELLVNPSQGKKLPLPRPLPSFVKDDQWRSVSARTLSTATSNSSSAAGSSSSAGGATSQVGAAIQNAMFGTRGEPVGKGRSQLTYYAPLRSRYAHVSSRSGTAQGTFPVANPLPKMVHGSLSAADSDIRGDLAHNVLLVGGGSLIPGLATRLQAELSGVIPSAFKPRVLTASPIERRFAPWIGGSIFSSLGTFQQLWVSRMEYEEEGAGIVERRCP